MNVPYQVGETVDITLRNAVIIHSVNGYLDIELPDHEQMCVQVDGDGIEITRRVPAEGEPQPGDVWSDRTGDLWFAARHYPDYDNREDSRGINGDGWRTVLVPDRVGEQGSPVRPEFVNEQYGPLKRQFRARPQLDHGLSEAAAAELAAAVDGGQ
ncbi:hypothetical protein OG884_15735 [Streptosporangium sp. NBC_01755]|uniref:hypothetical protein n=1 Tax=Streptosporangium sp. NBC_01755 TaxID=2975949 RepID=UPI002DD8065D|nr:hypothetical protein [Streptosporangium sp. NBC_01755]WSD03285.1 hypothetical protein OG884_15735 [Streptosporangium sp. NBC_01755]